MEHLNPGIPGFNPRTPCGVRPLTWAIYENGSGFNPRTPCGVRPVEPDSNNGTRCFNPRTPCGVRPASLAPTTLTLQFQSTHSLRSATAQSIILPPSTLFQSTHSLRSATAGLPAAQADAIVSIHALLAECDGQPRNNKPNNDSFNPRTPCGVRQVGVRPHFRRVLFQSTHSLRSATGPLGTDDADPTVSIHALLAECDALNDLDMVHMWVSIHALLAECDYIYIKGCNGYRGFNPRTPCGVRRTLPPPLTVEMRFQSTHSLRSATHDRRLGDINYLVSIHALLAECDTR